MTSVPQLDINSVTPQSTQPSSTPREIPLTPDSPHIRKFFAEQKSPRTDAPHPDRQKYIKKHEEAISPRTSERVQSEVSPRISLQKVVERSRSLSGSPLSPRTDETQTRDRSKSSPR